MDKGKVTDAEMYSLCTKAYKMYCDALRYKYDEFKFGAMQESNIVLMLVTKDGFDFDVIEQVIRNNSPSKHIDEEYFNPAVIFAVCMTIFMLTT